MCRSMTKSDEENTTNHYDCWAHYKMDIEHWSIVKSKLCFIPNTLTHGSYFLFTPIQKRKINSDWFLSAETMSHRLLEFLGLKYLYWNFIVNIFTWHKLIKISFVLVFTCTFSLYVKITFLYYTYSNDK